MNTVNYPARRSFIQYDDRHHLLYLNEQPVAYTPEHISLGDEAEPEPHYGEAGAAGAGSSTGQTSAVTPVEGFAYTGPMEDGSTMITATEATYGSFVAGLLRLRYSADDVEALQANMTEALHTPDHPRAAEFSAAWLEFQTYRSDCKAVAREVLNRISDREEQ